MKGRVTAQGDREGELTNIITDNDSTKLITNLLFKDNCLTQTIKDIKLNLKESLLSFFVYFNGRSGCE